MVREAFARALRERLDGRIDPVASAAVDKVADMSTSTRSLLWLLGRSARDVRGDSPTLGIENQLMKLSNEITEGYFLYREPVTREGRRR